MALGSYAPVYTWAKRQLLKERARVEYFVLDVICQHADCWGRCYPGNRKLADIIGYAESTIDQAVKNLEARGWIQVTHTKNPRRGYTERDFQVSVEVLYIRDELVEEALRTWGETGDRNEIVINVVQPEQPEPKPESLNQNKEPDQPTSARFENDALATASAAHNSPKGKSPEKLHKQPTQQLPTTAQSATEQQPEGQKTKHPPGSGAPPRKLRQYYSALPLVTDEEHAIRISKTYGMRVCQARQAVAEYGVEKVKRVEGMMDAIRSKGEAIRNPAGFLVAKLRQPLTEPEPEKYSEEYFTQYENGYMGRLLRDQKRTQEQPHADHA